MSDTFKKVKNGEKLRIPASTYNAMIDAARDCANRKNARADSDASGVLPVNMVYIKNSSGVNVDRLNILGISNSMIDVASNNFKQSTILEGIKPLMLNHSSGRFVITAEPIKIDAVGRACITGYFPILVDVTTESHIYADVNDNIITSLKSVETGPAVILWKESGLGVKWAMVRFGGSGGGSATQLRGKIVVAPTFQDPYASSDSPAYAGFGYYIVRLIDEPAWISGTEYPLNSKVTNPSDNRVYIMTNTDPEGMESPNLAPHENAIDWTISEEIKIEYASCLYDRQTESGIPIKDCTSVYPIGKAVKITEFKKQNGSTIYLLDESIDYVGTPEERTLTMYEGKLMAVYQ